MNAKVLFLLGLVGLTAADKRPSTSYGPPVEQGSFEFSSSSSDESSEPVKYDFQFIVKDEYSGNDFQHQESRDDDNTRGSYTVQLPDGRLQKVTYYVEGDSGYVADVSFEGEARYPDSDESREYSAPRVSYSAPQSQEPQSYTPPRSSYGVPQ